MKNTLFGKVIYKGILGAMVGLGTGLILGMLIWYLQDMVSVLTQKESYAAGQPPASVITFLGMSIGTIIGAFAGIQIAFKEQKK